MAFSVRNRSWATSPGDETKILIDRSDINYSPFPGSLRVPYQIVAGWSSICHPFRRRILRYVTPHIWHFDATGLRFVDLIPPPLGLPQPEQRTGHYNAALNQCSPFFPLF